jgi:hypothetical protein
MTLQRIEKIEGLQGCPHLKKLWLIENRIGVIENLEPCTELQELYLTSNRITAFGGVAHLTGLKVRVLLILARQVKVVQHMLCIAWHVGLQLAE